MTSRDLFSLIWLFALLGSIAAISGAFANSPARATALAPVAAVARAQTVLDATGHSAPIKRYRRIASASPLADHVLLELAEPAQVYAVSAYGKQHDPERHRYGDRRTVSGPDDLELLVSAGVDLLLVDHLGTESQLERARASGIVVFDLGEMRGLSTLRPNILALASLLGDRSRGERLWQRFSRRFQAIANDVPTSQRKRAIYLAFYAGKLFGGTRGTSYHDVLNAAGLDDIAAEHYRDWPQYDPEQLLALDPPCIVTGEGMAQALCENRWYALLQACRDRRRGMIEMPNTLMGDSGLLMLDAAETLHDRAYPSSIR